CVGPLPVPVYGPAVRDLLPALPAGPGRGAGPELRPRGPADDHRGSASLSRVPALPGAAPRAVDAELRGRVRALGRVRRGADRPRAPPPELWRGGPRLGGGRAGGPG